MQTILLTMNIAWQGIPASLPEVIEAGLRQHGEPLRWAITQVQPSPDVAGEWIAQVEAVVTV
jgi:hypothetical protein